MKILVIYPSTRGLQPTGKRSYTIFPVFPKTQKNFKLQKIIQKSKTQKRLEIWNFSDILFDQRSPVHQEALLYWFFCFSSGPWSTVPKANILIGTMKHGLKADFLLGTEEHGPEGKYSPWDLVPRKRCTSGLKNIESVQNGPKLVYHSWKIWWEN